MGKGQSNNPDTIKARSDALSKAVYELTEAAFDSLNSKEFLSVLKKILADHLPINSVILNSYDNLNNNFDFLLNPFEKDGKEFQSLHEKIIEKISNLVINSQKPILINSKNNYEIIDSISKDIEFISAVALPLKDRDNSLYDVLIVTNDDVNNELDEDHKNFLTSFGYHASALIKQIERKNNKDSEENKFKTLFAKNPLMIFITDKNGVIQETNEKVLSDLLYESSDLVGKHITEVFHPDDKEKVEFNLQECLLKRDKTHTWELRKLNKNGEVVWVRESATALPISDDEVQILVVCENISDYKEASDKLKENEELYRLLAENTNDLIILHDFKGNIKYNNSACSELSEFSSEELKRMNVENLFGEDYRKKFYEYSQKDYKNVGLFLYEVYLLTKNGEELPLEINVSKLKKRDDEENLLIVARDVRERKKVEERIKLFNKELQKSNHAKDKFFSIIAHDLKSPFNALLSYSDILMNEYEDLDRVEVKEYVSHINNVSKNVYDLLDNLLNWARLQIDKIYPDPSYFNLEDIVYRVIRLYENLANQKKIKINTNFENHCFVFADENMVSTILRNLVSNAVKFTNEKGIIEIEIKNKDDFIELSITDDGVGMLPEDIEKIFQVDVNYSTLGTNKERGTGLGLILSKELVEIQNGTISVKSELSKGSTFTVNLPANII